MPRWRQGLYAALTIALVLAAVELMLGLFGVRPLSVTEDPYVGFSGRLPLFVEETRDGVQTMTTARNKLRYFNQQSFPRQKPAGAYRIFCLGGSTTYGHPWDDAMSFCGWLRRFLAAVDPSRQWEVINAGGISYASYRITSLMEELNTYQPDLYLLYTGHNEFLEERSYRGIRQLPRGIVEANAVLGRSRLFTAIRSAVGAAPKPFMLNPEVLDRLSKTIGPENYHRDDATRADIVEHFHFNLKRMITLARGAGSDIAFVTPSANLKDMGPFKSENSLPAAAAAAWQQGFAAALATPEPATRLARLDALRRDDERYALLHFERGRALLALQRPGEAEGAFVRALEEDVAPLRVLPAMTADLRAVSRDQAVTLIDFKAVLEERTRAQLGHPILGQEWFTDHVHLSIEGYRLLGLELLRHLEKRGVLTRPIDPATIARAAEQGLATLDAHANGKALMNLGIVLGWGGKLEEAHRLLRDAHQLMGDDLIVLLRLGNSAERLGRWNEAAGYLERAAAANPTSAEPQRWLADLAKKTGDAAAERRHRLEAVRLAPKVAFDLAALAELLAAQGDWREAARYTRELAAVAPKDAAVRANLGVVLANGGDLAAARAAFEEARRLDPASVDACLGLASLSEAAGNRTQARALYAEAVKMAPGNVIARLSFGVFLANTGQIGEAIEHFRAAVRLDPNSADGHMNLATALRQTGREDEARPHFETALRLRGQR